GAEVVMDALRPELVVLQVRFALQQAEIRLRHRGHPRARLETDRAVAAEGARRKIGVGLEPHRPAMAAALQFPFHDVFAFHRPIMRPSGSRKRLSVPMPGTSCSSITTFPPASLTFLRYAARSSTLMYIVRLPGQGSGLSGRRMPPLIPPMPADCVP